MSEPNEVTAEPEGFATRIQREAREEAETILAELVRLRFRADQVGHVLRALKLPYPDGLQALLTGGRLDGGPDLQTDLGVPVPLPAGYPLAPAEEGPVILPRGRTEPPDEPEPPEPAAAAAAAPTPVEPAAAAQRPRETPEACQRRLREEAAERREAGVTRRTPTHPGAEAMPEHLRRMPAASGNGPLNPRIVAAKNQRTVYEDIRDNPGSLPPEVAARVGMPEGRVGQYVRALAEAGLIEKTGTRLKHGVTTGRVGNEWRVPRPRVTVDLEDERDAPEVTAPVPPPSAAEAACRPAARPVAEAGASPSTTEHGTDVITRARDWICGREDPFTEVQFAAAAGIKLESARPLLVLFQERKIVTDLSAAGMPLWEYEPPLEMGAAAEMDRARAKGLAAAAPRAEGSAPVEGTGSGRYSSHPATQALCVQAKALGATIERTGSGHIIIRNRGERVVLAHTPASGSLDKTRKRLNAIGVRV